MQGELSAHFIRKIGFWNVYFYIPNAKGKKKMRQYEFTRLPLFHTPIHPSPCQTPSFNTFFLFSAISELSNFLSFSALPLFRKVLNSMTACLIK